MCQIHQRGVALILALWVVALLSSMAAAVVMTTRTDLSLVRNHLAEAQLRAIAEAATTMVAFRLKSPAQDDQWLPDGIPHQWNFNGNVVEIRLYNEGSRIDLNGATNEVLSNLIQAVGVDPADATRLAKAVVDWRDPDDSATLGGGAETHEYKAAGRPYGSKNAPFTSVAELRLVLGFTPDIINAIADALTTHGNGNTVLQDYASPLVLAALGVTSPPTTSLNAQHNLGGPAYRIVVRLIDGGPTQETVFRLGGSGISQVTILERH